MVDYTSLVGVVLRACVARGGSDVQWWLRFKRGGCMTKKSSLKLDFLLNRTVNCMYFSWTINLPFEQELSIQRNPINERTMVSFRQNFSIIIEAFV